MKIKVHETNSGAIAEIVSDEVVITNLDDATDLIGNLYYHDTDKVILHEKTITPAFFDLQNKLAGNILQKFSNYRMRVAIIGDFEKYPGKSLRDLIRESNKGRQINFVSSREEALGLLAN